MVGDISLAQVARWSQRLGKRHDVVELIAAATERSRVDVMMQPETEGQGVGGEIARKHFPW